MKNSKQNTIITAGASGIGLAIAQKFLAAGATVHICDISAATLERALRDNPGLQGSLVDVSNTEQVETFFAQAITAMGGIDVLVNNAGISGPRNNIEEISYADWDHCLRTNLSSMFYCSKQVIPLMKAQNHGVIINLSTVSANTAVPGRLPYVASKAGVSGLSHNLARELGPFNIRCNTLLPGLVDNPRGRALVDKVAQENNLTVAEAEQRFLQYISMGSWIQTTDIADMTYFLASDAARHITAQEIAIDGNVEWEA